MTRQNKITIFISGAWFLTLVAFVARPTPKKQLCSMLLTLIFLSLCLSNVIHVFRYWRKKQGASLIPLGLCALFMFLAPRTGFAIKRFLFQRSLPHYEAVIRQMKEGSIPVSDQYNRIYQVENDLACAIFAQRETNGVLSVFFMTGSGFPFKHSGYLYCSSGNLQNSDLAARWPGSQEIRPFWFEISK